MRLALKRIYISICAVLFPAAPISFAQFPHSVVCQFERIATATLDSTGKIVTGNEPSSGEMVLLNLNSTAPIVSGNVRAAHVEVLQRSDDAIWLAFREKAKAVVSVITLFRKTGILMHTKHEMLPTVDGEIPFGFVEIGKCRPIK
jgi:hypothetical protein